MQPKLVTHEREGFLKGEQFANGISLLLFCCSRSRSRKKRRFNSTASCLGDQDRLPNQLPRIMPDTGGWDLRSEGPYLIRLAAMMAINQNWPSSLVEFRILERQYRPATMMATLTSRPGGQFRAGEARPTRARTFSQAPQAVRSARGRRWN
jgi:hypothetical protein